MKRLLCTILLLTLSFSVINLMGKGHRWKWPKVRRRPHHTAVQQTSFDGIDVSHHNGVIDWGKVARNRNMKFVYVKATEGGTHQDTRFRTNRKEARKMGLNVGVYHFFNGKSSGSKQFSNFYSTVGSNRGNLIPMVDVEEAAVAGMSPKQLQKELGDFCRRVQNTYGVKPVIYTGMHVYDRLMGGKFDSHILWIANYNRRPSMSGRAKCSIWQFTEKGRVPGINGYTDLNRFVNGMTLSRLRR